MCKAISKWRKSLEPSEAFGFGKRGNDLHHLQFGSKTSQLSTIPSEEGPQRRNWEQLINHQSIRIYTRLWNMQQRVRSHCGTNFPSPTGKSLYIDKITDVIYGFCIWFQIHNLGKAVDRKYFCKRCDKVIHKEVPRICKVWFYISLVLPPTESFGSPQTSTQNGGWGRRTSGMQIMQKSIHAHDWAHLPSTTSKFWLDVWLTVGN